MHAVILRIVVAPMRSHRRHNYVLLGVCAYTNGGRIRTDTTMYRGLVMTILFFQCSLLQSNTVRQMFYSRLKIGLQQYLI